LLESESLYIQPPKCITRQGLIKGGKKMYCDLLFTNENNSFVKWIEDLETYSQSYIFNNRERWFDNQLELEDIADSFLSVLKIYKSGKYYILRTIVPGNVDNCQLKLYDENENLINHDILTDSTNVIPILEFKGIKCTSRNFQVDIEIKQMMILKPSLLFEKCVIKNNHDSLGNKEEQLLDIVQIKSVIENKKVVNDAMEDKKVVIEDKKVVIEDKKEEVENKKETIKNESSYNGGFMEVDFLKQMTSKIQLVILGDNLQGIYEFKGSDVRFLTMAEELWKHKPFLKTTIFHHCTLKTSYRVTNQMAQFINTSMLNCDESNKVLYACRDVNAFL
jgi:hypothetical protein